MDASDAVESYINGNISEVKKWLKKTSKMQVLEFASILEDHGGVDGIKETTRLLR